MLDDCTTSDIAEDSFIVLDTSKHKQSYLETLDSCLSPMDSFSMKHSEKDEMFRSCLNIVNQMSVMNKEMIQQENGMDPLHVIEATSIFFSNAIATFTTRYKRDKQICRSPRYVAPKEMAIGTRIEFIYDKEQQLQVPRLIQSTMQVVPIISTLKSFFNQQENFDMYFKHQAEHRCQENVLENFCCGRVFKEQEFFQRNPDAIQIQLAIDDVELLNVLGSKSGLLKACAVYFIIRNIPHKFNSKLNNIFLVCICTADDLKTKNTDINNIWEVIVDEIKYLEQTGIKLNNGKILKGSLVGLAADNLGGKVALCMAESFNAIYYCRICKLSKTSCQTTLRDDLEQYRNGAHYSEMLEIVNNSENVDFQKTCGIKRYCVLNDLNHFDIFKNYSVDIMHDLNEGTIFHLLNHTFRYLDKNKVLKEEDLKDMAKYYQYPMYFRRDKPSELNKKRSNLGQNAAQMKCLFLNLPFMFLKYEHDVHVKKIWPCVTTLLDIFQIVYSEVIDEADLIELEERVAMHLKLLKEILNTELIPKHHFMTHYPNIIRMMGPLIHMSMFRFDAKHTDLKKFVRNTKNTINLNKTIAIKHQQSLANGENSFSDNFFYSKQKEVKIGDIEQKYDQQILSHIINSAESFEIGTFSFNSYKYRRGSIISFQKSLLEIETILLTDGQLFIVAKKLEFLEIHGFSRSIKVRKPNESLSVLIKYTDIEHKKPYCCKFVDQDRFIIIDSRDILKTL